MEAKEAMRVISIFLTATTLLALEQAHAQSGAPEKLFAALTRCDGAFFESMRSLREELAPQGRLDERGRSVTWLVPEITHPTESRVFFNSPLKVNGLEMIGYYDELIRIPGGVAVSWGFLVSSNIPDANAKLRALVWDTSRLRQGEGYFVRSEIWSHSNSAAGWAREASEPGPPKPGTVERVFMIEPYDGETAYVRAGCSLQGSITREMVGTIRPDLPLQEN